VSRPIKTLSDDTPPRDSPNAQTQRGARSFPLRSSGAHQSGANSWTTNAATPASSARSSPSILLWVDPGPNTSRFCIVADWALLGALPLPARSGNHQSHSSRRQERAPAHLEGGSPVRLVSGTTGLGTRVGREPAPGTLQSATRRHGETIAWLSHESEPTRGRSKHARMAPCAKAAPPSSCFRAPDQRPRRG
jgi:hypothetical protein